MALIVEDGTGKGDANSYASIAEIEAYFSQHLYATAWDAATTPQKEASAIMAARWLTVAIKWDGYRVSSILQSLSWPRYEAWTLDHKYIASDIVPTEVKNAQAELSQGFLESNVVADPDDYGIKKVKVDTIEVEFDKLDRKPFIVKSVIDLLDGLGVAVGGHSLAIGRT